MVAKQKTMRTIRSFVKREGKLTKGQQNAIDDLWPDIGINKEDGLLDLKNLFTNSNPVVLEIGFGNGLSLAEMAQAHPQMNFFGIEVHRPGMGSLLVQVKKCELVNVRASMDDAVDVVNNQVPDVSLDRIQVFFPDPWHKKRHHKRRLLQPEFITQLTSKLKTGGKLHVATDWQNYAEYILEVLEGESMLKNTTVNYAQKPDYRPLTKYEQRGINLGHGVWDLVFEKL